MSPLQANDTSVVIEGCGNQPLVGYTYCRVFTGRIAEKGLVFHVPPVRCQKADCIHVKVIMPSGSPAVGFAVKSGETRLEVSWKTLLGRDVFQAGDRGFWIVLIEIQYLDNDGILHKTLIEGEIRLRVLDPSYISLENIAGDSNFVWHWSYNDRQFKMTSNGRTFMAGKTEDQRDFGLNRTDHLSPSPFYKEPTK